MEIVFRRLAEKVVEFVALSLGDASLAVLTEPAQAHFPTILRPVTATGGLPRIRSPVPHLVECRTRHWELEGICNNAHLQT